MAILTYEFTIPYNTLHSEPKEELIILQHGHINRIDIKFKNGCAHMVRFRMYSQLKQIIPFIEGQYLIGNNQIVSVPSDLQISGISQELLLQGSSQGTLYNHTLLIWPYYDDIEPTKQASALETLLRLVPH